MKHYILGFALFTSACMPPDSHILYNNEGGHIQNFDTYFKEREYVEVYGNCKSSCTKVLSHENFCIGENVTFWFHGSFPKSFDPEMQKRLDWQMAKDYPPVIQRAYMKEWRLAPGNAYTVISAEEIERVIGKKMKRCKS